MTCTLDAVKQLLAVAPCTELHLCSSASSRKEDVEPFVLLYRGEGSCSPRFILLLPLPEPVNGVDEAVSECLAGSLTQRLPKGGTRLVLLARPKAGRGV